MRKALSLVVVGLLGCSPSGPRGGDEAPAASPSQASPEPEPEAEPEPEPEPAAEPEPEPAADGITVLMTAATLADDCGGAANVRFEPTPREKSDRAPASKMKGKRRCKQSSIQLAVTSPEGSPSAKVTVKSVELFLADGESLGVLQTREPSVWSDEGGYMPWNERVEPGQDLSVSYAITQPDWGQVEDRRSQSYKVEAVISIAGTDQTLEQNVVVDTPTSLPPGVKT